MKQVRTGSKLSYSTQDSYTVLMGKSEESGLEFDFRCNLYRVKLRNPQNDKMIPKAPNSVIGIPNKIDVTIMAKSRRTQLNAA